MIDKLIEENKRLEEALIQQEREIQNLRKINEEHRKINGELRAELSEANDSITWWHNRFNALERDNKHLNEQLDQALKDYDELLDKGEIDSYGIMDKKSK